MTSPDFITVVRAHGRRLAKLVRADGIVENYDNARTFDLITYSVPDLDALAGLLDRPDRAVLRGAVVDPARTRKVRRLLHPDPDTGEAPTLREQPRRWLALDLGELPVPAGIDPRDLPACAEVAGAALPPAFPRRARRGDCERVARYQAGLTFAVLVLV